MSCALRVNPATSQGQGQRPSPAVRGSKTGLVIRRPFAFCRMVVPVYVLLWSLRGLCGGRFPANAPHPPGGHVKQMHARTRSCGHPRPGVTLCSRRLDSGARPAVPAGQSRSRGWLLSKGRYAVRRV